MSLQRKEIETNTPNLIRHIRENYDPNRPPSIVEPIQNSQDAYAQHLNDGVIEDSRALRITFRINVDEGYVEISDNAGGMSRDIISNVVPEIDTTSPDKAGGGNVGSEGRGLFAVVGGGKKLYIETLNTNGERLATILFSDDGTTLEEPVLPRKIADDPEEDVIQDAPQLRAPEGTLLKLTGLETSAVETLSDWDEVHRVISELFSPLFSRDDVELIYIVEEGGEVSRHTPEVPRLDDLMNEELERFDKHEFTAHGEDHVLTDVVFGRAAQSYPWDGIAFFKGNEYFDGPVMMVDDYSTKIASLTGDDPEMIAWCRIDECPDIEDPSHQKLTIRKRRTGLRELAQQVHADHFAEESASDEQEINQILRDTVNAAVNDLTEEYFQDFANLEEQGALRVEEETGEDTLRGEDGSLLTLNPQNYPESTGEINIETRVYPPDTPGFDEYIVHDITIRSDALDDTLELDDPVLVEAVPDEIQEEPFSWTADEEAWYRIDAAISGVPEGEDSDEWIPGNDDIIDTTMLMLPVGIEPRGEQPPSQGGDGGSGPGDGTDGEGESTTDTATIFNDINEIADQDNYVFAEAFLDGAGGFTVNLNKAHPKWRGIYRNANRDEERIQKHQEFGSKKIARAVVEDLKFVQMEQAADEVPDKDGLLDEAFAIQQQHEAIYAELENNVEDVVEEGLIDRD